VAERPPRAGLRSVASVRLRARCVGRPDELRLIGQPLPCLGHFDEKSPKVGIGRGARFAKAACGVSLIELCQLHTEPQSHW
jgi:hypothetical protein